MIDTRRTTLYVSSMTSRKHTPDGTVDELIRHLYVERRFSDREIAVALGDGWSRVEVTRRRLGMGVRPADRPPAQEALAS